MEIVLVHPEIPHNTGCAARLAAATGVRLHLVEPLGFSLEDRYLKRAGLDYWPQVDLVVHPDWSSVVAELDASAVEPGAHDRRGMGPIGSRLRLFTARGGTSLFDVDFGRDDVLVFGAESCGLPVELLERYAEQRVYVPVRPGVRSLNLANTVCLGTYVALNSSGAALPDNDGSYVAHPRSADDVRPREMVRVVPRRDG